MTQPTTFLPDPEVRKYIASYGILEISDGENEPYFPPPLRLGPKVYTQIYQFKYLINLLQINLSITWTQLAIQAGYYDRSYMSRHLKEYLKVSPNSIVNLDMLLIDYLNSR